MAYGLLYFRIMKVPVAVQLIPECLVDNLANIVTALRYQYTILRFMICDTLS